jgi:Zn-finger nucleic acid-binding protein
VLDSLRVGEIELDECPSCLGMWFDQGELHAVLTSRMALKVLPQASTGGEQTAPSNIPGSQRLGPCCRCGGLLLEQRSGQHLLAGCARCGGFWVPVAAFKALRARQPAPEPETGSRPAAAVKVRGRCTACDATLVLEERGGQKFHRCPRCGGVFLPRGGLAFILAHAPGVFEPGREVPEGVPENAACPACRVVVQPISWQGKPVRVWACTQCWGTFAPAAALNQLQDPDAARQEGFEGVGGGLWKMLDAMVDWLVNPPKNPHGF